VRNADSQSSPRAPIVPPLSPDCVAPCPSQSPEPPVPLVGIAKLAAASAKSRERAGVEYFELPCRSVLNRESSGRMPFAWTINPYRGCEVGCKYCYARYTHEFMELRDGRDFERKIFAKVSAPDVFRRELAAHRDRGLPIALGTATDPYQPAEQRFRITRRMLEAIARFDGLDFSITTKGTLILRDLDLLREISRRNRFHAHITVTTTNARLARLLEPKAPPPAKRLDAIRRLVRAGLCAGLNAAPILPGLTDSPAQLDALARAASEHQAQFFFTNVLYLKSSAMAQFMPFLEKEFPRLVRRYRRLYRRSAYPPEDYQEQVRSLITRLRQRYSLSGRREESAIAKRYEQLALGL
jgi:DNA repair photolyase